MMNFTYCIEFAMYGSVILALMWIGNLVMNMRVKLTHNGQNLNGATYIAQGVTALGFRRSGFQMGLAIAMMGVMLTNTEHHLLQDLTETVVYGAIALVFMLISLTSTDKIILPKIDNSSEVYNNNNIAVGVVELGALIMTGCIAFASIYGDNGGLVSSLAFFVLGQVTVIGVVLLFEKITQEDLIANIGQGKVASGVYLAGKVVAYGCIMMSAIKGNLHTEVLPALTEFGIAAIVGVAFLYVSEKVIDKIT